MTTSRKKLHNKWHLELKKYLAEIFPTPFCEKCYSTRPPIDIAHSLKRRFISSKAEYFEAALLCRQCHNYLELQGDHSLMQREIIKILNKRTKIL